MLSCVEKHTVARALFDEDPMYPPPAGQGGLHRLVPERAHAYADAFGPDRMHVVPVVTHLRLQYQVPSGFFWCSQAFHGLFASCRQLTQVDIVAQDSEIDVRNLCRALVR